MLIFRWANANNMKGRPQGSLTRRATNAGELKPSVLQKSGGPRKFWRPTRNLGGSKELPVAGNVADVVGKYTEKPTIG